MGLNLGSLGKKITDFLGGAERQLNPFDHGATFSNPNPVQTPAPQPVAPHTLQEPIAPRPFFGAPPPIAPAPTAPVTNPFSVKLPQPAPAPLVTVPKVNMPLEEAKQAIMGTIGSLTSPKQIRDATVSTLRTFPQTVESAALSLTHQTQSDPSTYNPVEKALLGSTSVIKGTGQNYRDLANTVPGNLGTKTPNWLAAPAGVLLAGTNFWPGGTAEKTALEDVAKAGTADAVRAAITKHAGADVAATVPDNVITALAKESNPNKIQTILKGGGDVPKPTVTVKKPSVAQSTDPRITPMTPDWPTDGLPKPAETPPKFTEKQRQATGKNNPVTVSLPTIAEGDHAGAIVNKQRVQSMIDQAGSRAVAITRKLSREEQAQMPHLIEHPELPRSPLMEAAIDAHRKASDIMHAVNQELRGAPTAYRSNHALHDWNLPEEMTNAPGSFAAVNDQARLHPTIEHGQAAGLQLKDRPYADAMQEYYQRGSAVLGKQALEKGITEADAGAKATRVFDLGGGRGLPTTDAGKIALRGMERAPDRNILTKGYDSTTKALKQTLLSLTQFHPINISRKAGSAMLLTGHPLQAAKGVRDTFASISKHYSDRLQAKAVADGTYDDAARIGTPIGTSSDYSVSGKISLKHGIGEKMIFERQMPALHTRMVQSLVSDLKRKSISLDSVEARQAGQRINEIMGFVNVEVRGLDSGVQRGLSRILLAPQFTRSKWATLKGVATDQGLARRYAIAAVLGDTAAVFATSAALGYLFGQKQDSITDTLIRSLIHPSIATPFHEPNLDSNGKQKVDAQGNPIPGKTIEIGLPSTYVSEAIGLIANLQRNDKGHLGVNFDLSKLPGNLANYGRARLNVPLSTGLKVATNTDFANKPLWDDQADTGTKIKQATTSIGKGLLPIGTQAFTKGGLTVNSAVNAAVSAVGGTARTDKTTGQGLQTTQYFDARDAARGSLNTNDKANFDAINQAPKNAVTGAYQVTPSVWDTQKKATVLLDNPKVLDATNALNATLKSHGQAIDPLYDVATLGAKNQSIMLTYSTLNQSDPQKAEMVKENPWITGVQQQRSDFFNSLPEGDPNKPAAPVPYPTAPAPVAALQDQYFKMTDPAQKSAFIKSNPDLVAQFAKEDEYNRTVRGIKNLPQYDTYPVADPATQKILDLYNSLPKSKAGGNTGADSGARSNWIRNNPAAYAQMGSYLMKTSLYAVQQASQSAAFKNNGMDQSGLKAISGLAQDIGKTTDSNGNVSFSLGASSGSGTGSGSSNYVSRTTAKSKDPVRYNVALHAGKKKPKGAGVFGKKMKVGKKGGTIKSATHGTNRPKVSIKKSLV